MTEHTTTEDLFVDFIQQVDANALSLQTQDLAATSNFYQLITTGKQLTQAQSYFILRILTKYKNLLHKLKISTDKLDNPIWSKPFRVIDHDCFAGVEIDEYNNPLLTLKNPYHIKDLFEKQVLDKNREVAVKSQWRAEERIRTYTLYDINPMLLQEFLRNNGFIISSELAEYFLEVEEIYENSEKYFPHCLVEDNRVILKHQSQEAENYFNERKTHNLIDDLMLAKNLGFRLTGNCEKIPYSPIFSAKTNFFWSSDIEKFFEFSETVSGKKIIVVNSYKTHEWIKNFVEISTKTGVPYGKIKVAFREKNDERNVFNQWIKDNGLGGDLKTADYLIFKDKPAKWLFNEKEGVKIIAINEAFMPSSKKSQQWIEDHYCVFFLGNTKPTNNRGKKFGNL